MNDRPTPASKGSPGPTVSRLIHAPVDRVWAVLTDGWSYATWVVGASRVRSVDGAWPAAGTRIGHSFGPWPLTIEDYTRAERCEPMAELVLTARAWPVGEARVRLRLDAKGPESCEATMNEDAVRGPGTLVPAPLRHLILIPRNRESLYRLALLAEGRERASG